MLVAEVFKLVITILAVSKRSFLSLKRIETYLLSATNNRLNHLLILHIHKLLTRETQSYKSC